MTTENTTTIQNESIKLVKNSKGFNWEIKIHIEEKADTETLNRLFLLNENLERKYGGGKKE